jgi:hypothetical protein
MEQKRRQPGRPPDKREGDKGGGPDGWSALCRQGTTGRPLRPGHDVVGSSLRFGSGELDRRCSGNRREGTPHNM